MFNYRIANYNNNTIFVGTDVGFDLFAAVICCNLYVELVFLLFILCIPFDILLSVEVES